MLIHTGETTFFRFPKTSISIGISGEKRYKCDICDKAFTASSTRGKHMKMVHNPEERANRKPSERRFKCEICEQAFSRKMNLNVHMKSHSTSRGILGQDDETEECPICFKIIAKNSKYHMKTHEKGVKVYECKVCDAKFNQSESLRAHMSHHTGIKDFVCSVCSKAFSVSSRLTKHMRIHTGEKRYWSEWREQEQCKMLNDFLSTDLFVKFVNAHSPTVRLCIDIERFTLPKRISYVKSAPKHSRNQQVFSFTCECIPVETNQIHRGQNFLFKFLIVGLQVRSLTYVKCVRKLSTIVRHYLSIWISIYRRNLSSVSANIRRDLANRNQIFVSISFRSHLFEEI